MSDRAIPWATVWVNHHAPPGCEIAFLVETAWAGNEFAKALDTWARNLAVAGALCATLNRAIDLRWPELSDSGREMAIIAVNALANGRKVTIKVGPMPRAAQVDGAALGRSARIRRKR